ncbi:MAG: hypothetical protein ACOYEO_02970 [bacterium]|jgi:YHS domain-containing protein
MGLDSLTTLGEGFHNSMMGMLNFFALMFFLRLVFSLILTMGQGITSARNPLKRQAEPSQPSLDLSEKENPIDSQKLVCDKICGREIPRQNSYIVATDDGYYYFCSWDCRQKFVDSLREIETETKI